MGTGHRCGILVAAFVLSSTRAVVSGPIVETQRFTSPQANLAFDVPLGLRAQERRLFVDQGRDAGANLTVIDLLPDQALAPSLPAAPVATITVKDVLETPSLSALANDTVAGCEPMAFVDTEVLVGGAPALRRESPAVLQILLARGPRTYRLSAGADAEGRAALEAVARTLRFEAGSAKVEAPGASALGQAMAPSAVGDPTVRAVYLVPSDRQVQPGHLRAIERALRQLQVYYRNQLGGGRTFRLNDPVVEVVPTTHPVAWYQSEAPAADPTYRFWNGVTGDGLSLTGGSFDDPTNRWLFFVEADSLCGQVGGAGTNGVAVLPANDLRNLLCESLVPSCPGDAQYPGVCVSTGGIGHELGHTFNLPHPTPGSCPFPDQDCENALMWLGYLEFPNAYLTGVEEDSLLDSPQTAPFFTVLNPGPLASPCTNGCPPPRPSALSAAVAGPTIQLTWSGSAGATSYTVRRATGSGGSFEVAAAGIGGTSWVDPSRPGGETYAYSVTAVGPNGESRTSATASATLPANVLSIADATWTEGNAGTGMAVLTVSLSPPSGAVVTASFESEPGTAAPGVDYDAVTGQVSFAAGATTATIEVPVHGDTEDEGAETVRLRLLAPVNAQIGRAEALLTIDDDDPAVLEHGFFPVPPCRVLDTRDAPGPLGGPALVASGDRKFPLTGVCEVPAGAKAVALNITVTGATAPGHLRFYPADALIAPETSALNYIPDSTRANNLVVALDPTGQLMVFCGQPEGTVDLIVDVSGYFR